MGVISEDAITGATADQLRLDTLWLRALARSLVGNDAAADDLVQETWLATVRRRPAGREPLRPWLATVLYNAWRKGFRATTRRESREAWANLAPSADPDPESCAAMREAERVLSDAVSALTEPHRSTILLHFYEGLSAAQIARRTGVPASTVRSRIGFGLDKLRAHLDQRHATRHQWMSALIPLVSGPAPSAASAGSATTAKGIVAMLSTKSVLFPLLGLFAMGTTAVAWSVSQNQEETRAPRSSDANTSAASPSSSAATDPNESPLPRVSRSSENTEDVSFADQEDGEHTPKESTIFIERPDDEETRTDGEPGDFLAARGSGETPGIAVMLESAKRTKRCIYELQRTYRLSYDWERAELTAQRADGGLPSQEELACLEEYADSASEDLLRDQVEELFSNELSFRRARRSGEPELGVDGKPYERGASDAQRVASPGGPSLGPDDAPVSVTVFGDFQCPFSARVVAALDEVRDEYPDSVKIVYKNLPLRFHEHARPAAEAAMAAHAQGKFWEMHDLLYAHQDSLDKASLISYAEGIELDVARFREELESGTHRSRIQEDIEEAAALGIRGTPSTLVNGKLLPGAHPAEAFIAEVEAALAANNAP